MQGLDKINPLVHCARILAALLYCSITLYNTSNLLNTSPFFSFYEDGRKFSTEGRTLKEIPKVIEQHLLLILVRITTTECSLG